MLSFSKDGKIPNNFVVNSQNNKNKPNILWSIFNKKMLFDGLVGVIKFSKTYKELLKTKNIEVVAVSNSEDEPDVDTTNDYNETISNNVEEADSNEQSKDIFINNDIQDNDIDDVIFNITLQIQSRFDVDNELKLAKPYFLSTMLLKDKVPLLNDYVPSNDEEMYDYLLIFWFRDYFVSATRKGLYRTYRRFEKNDDRLRGSIDVARHIKLNAGKDNGKIAYSYRENTVDNFMNCLIIKAYDCLKTKYYDLMSESFDNFNGNEEYGYIDLKKIIDTIKDQLTNSDYNDMYVLSKNIRPIASPFYNEYEELRKICIKILRNEGITFFDGTQDDEIYGILFYMPDLWEQYLEGEFIKLINNLHNDDIKIDFKSQDKSKSCFEYNNKYIQQTIPDYVFFNTDNERDFMILDAKFKPGWGKVLKSEGNLQTNNILHDFDKCIRDMVIHNCNATGTIFPINEYEDESELFEMNYIKHLISDAATGKVFYTIPIIVPFISNDNETNYENWKRDFDDKLNKGLEIISKLLQDENR